LGLLSKPFNDFEIVQKGNQGPYVRLSIAGIFCYKVLIKLRGEKIDYQLYDVVEDALESFIITINAH